jgi:hypothetical protein
MCITAKKPRNEILREPGISQGQPQKLERDRGFIWQREWLSGSVDLHAMEYMAENMLPVVSSAENDMDWSGREGEAGVFQPHAGGMWFRLNARTGMSGLGCLPGKVL